MALMEIRHVTFAYRDKPVLKDVSVEIGVETRSYTAHTATGDERDTIWSKQKAAVPGFADYEANTSREIPVVILEPTT